MKDRIIQCVQCDRTFVFTAAEQERFTSRGFDMPRRCQECRKHKSKVDNDSERNRNWLKKPKRTLQRHDFGNDEGVW